MRKTQGERESWRSKRAIGVQPRLDERTGISNESCVFFFA